MKLLISFLIFLIPIVSLAEECLIDGEEIELTGKVWREAFPGPPNYTSIENGDEPQLYWILTTTESYCGKAESFESGELHLIEGTFSRFQLVLDPKQYSDNQSIVFNNAKVKGRLFSGHTGHHKTKMLLDVESIKAVE